MTLYLRKDFKDAWKGQDPHKILDEMDGEVFRSLEARRTYRFELNGKGYFAKVHHGVGWKEIVENLLHLRVPVIGARNEWQALNKLHQLGIDTMTPVAFGQKGCNPAKQHSFLVTEELANMSSLEDICDQWKQSPPPFLLRTTIIEKLAEISRILHSNGINHRDYYFCHFLVPDGSFEHFYAKSQNERKAFSQKKAENSPDLHFFLIDLHRTQIRSTLPERWQLKDLSGLYYSSMDYGFSRNDIFRFIRSYTGLPLKDALNQYQSLWSKVAKKAQKLYQRMERKAGHPNY